MSPQARAFCRSLIAGVAMALCILGIYGVVSYTVSLRTREMGIRMALGARPADVGWLVVHQGLVSAGIGVATGVFLSLALTRLIAALLFGVTPTDLLTLSGSTLLMLAVATLACYVPARRAMRVDPMVALRYE